MKKIHKYILLFLILTLIVPSSCKKREEGKVPPSGKKTVKTTFSSPQGAIYRPYNIVASFNAPMVPITTIGKLNSEGPIKLTPKVQGKHHWLGTQTVSFVPDTPLPFATKYAVTIDKDATNINGDGLIEPVSWTFETARPAVSWSNPNNTATEIGLNENILLYFNQPIDPKTVSRHLKLRVITKTEAGTENISEMRTQVRRPTVEEWKDEPGIIEHAVLILPEQNYPMAANVELSIDKDMVGVEGELPAGTDKTISFATYEPLKVVKIDCTTNCAPENEITVQFNNSVKPADAIKYVSIKPEVKLENDSDWETPYLYIRGDFQPNTEYNVTISRTLTDIHGNELGTENTFKYSTSQYTPALGLATGVGVIESNGPKEIAVTANNVQELDVRYRIINKRDDLISFINNMALPTAEDGSPDNTGVLEDKIAVTTEKNKAVVVPVSLNKALSGVNEGVLLVDISSPEVYTVYQDKKDFLHYTSLIQVTDIGITGKLYPSGLTIWTTSLSKGTPIEGVKIEVRNADNKIIWEGTTNTEGIAKADIVKQKEDEEDDTLYIFADSGNDFAFSASDWNRGFDPWEFGLFEKYGDEGLKAYLFTERGIYKPGETIHLKAIVREITDNGIFIPKNIKGTILASDNRGRNYFTQAVTFSEFGTTNADIVIPSYVATGHSNVNLEISEDVAAKKGEEKKEAKRKNFYTSVNIAVYTPAEFKVATKPSSENIIAGDKINVGIKADYLFGEPMKDSRINWSIYRYRSSFWPHGFEDYSFGMTFFDYDEAEEKKYGFMELEGKTDDVLNEKGEINIVIPTKSGEVNNTTDYMIESTVTDINEKAVSARTGVTVHPGQFYIGLNIPSFLTTTETPFDLNVISVDLDGKIIPGKSVQATLYKREWHTAKGKAVVGYTYETKPVDVEVASCSVTTTSEAAKCSLTPKTSGMHFIKATSTDSGGNPIMSSLWFYTTGTGEAAWKPESHDRIELVADKKEYAPGDTASILIKSPFETSHAMITVERDGIISQETKVLNGYAPTIKFEISDKYVPNVYVSVVIVKGRVSEDVSESGIDEGRPRVKIGYINLPVSAKSKKLTVVVETDKKEAAPGEEIEVTVKSKDIAGKPVKSEMTIMAVDTGSLMLTNYMTPNPFPTFYTEIGLGVTTTDSRIYLIGRRHFGVKGEPVGGGGAEGDSTLRSKFIPVAYWNPNVVTNESGEAKVKFTLPDNLTTFKIMAIGNTVDMFGSSDTQIISKKPFMIRTALPYFIAVGDKFQTGIVIHNYTDAPLSGTLKASATGIEITDAPEKEFNMEPGAETEIFFSLEATNIGDATLSFEANAGSVSDGVRVPLSIQVTQPKEVFTSYGDTDTTGKELIEPLKDVFPDLGGLDVSISSTALTGLKDASMYLIKYPYECLEQKISRAIGMLLYSNIAKAFNIEDDEVKTYPQKIEKTLFELYEYQKYDGGFSFWSSSSSHADPYLTIYAAYFMNMARESGYEVDGQTFKRAKEYIVNLLRSDSKTTSYSVKYFDSLKAYALYVLSLVGEPETGYYEALYNVRNTLSLTEHIQLLLAIKKTGILDIQYDDLIQYIDNHLAVSAAEAHIEDDNAFGEWTLRSDDYTNAYVLLALLKLKPDHPYISNIAKYLLSSSKHGYWRSTHTTVAVLASLYEYITTKEKDVPNYTATVKLGLKELLAADFKGRTTEEKNISVPAKDLMGLESPTELLFEKNGTGRLYYRTRLTYASTQTPLPPMEEGFTIYKKIEHYNPAKAGSNFKRGDAVKVHLEFIIPTARNYIVINDGLPAGLEAVNFSLSTAQMNLRTNSTQNFYIDHLEIYGDKVLIFANYISAGSYQFDYIAKATTKGTFSVPPANIEEMYNPEVFGRSMSGTMEIE